MTTHGIFNIPPQILTALENDRYDQARELIDAHIAEQDGANIVDFFQAERTITRREWLIPGWLPVGEFGVLAGRGMMGKSTAAIQLAYALATGAPEWLGLPIQGYDEAGYTIGSYPKQVLYVGYEDRKAELLTRIAYTAHAHNEPLDAGLIPNLWMAALQGKGAIWDSKRLTEVGEQVLAKAYGGALLIIDPSSKAFRDEENARREVAAFTEHFVHWAQSTGCAVLLLVHPPKGGGSHDNYFSGSTEWEAGARFAWSLGDEMCGAKDKSKCQYHEWQYHQQRRGTLRSEKGNYGRGAPVHLRMGTHTNWTWTTTDARPQCVKPVDGIEFTPTKGAEDYDNI